ncbi:MAG: PIN domain-containing protein [Candidatus Hydrothermarchaeales archaeon]
MRVYLDTNVWFRIFDEPSKRIIKEKKAFYKILYLSKLGRLKIVGSVFLDDEIELTSDKDKREAVFKFISTFLASKIDFIPKIYSVIMDKTRLTVKDSVHIACAIEAKAEYFITVDDEIIKKRVEIKKFGIDVVNPVEFIERF